MHEEPLLFKKKDVQSSVLPTLSIFLPNKLTFNGVQMIYTEWKFQDFSVTKILREIDFGYYRGYKTALLRNLKAMNFDFCKF